MHKLIQRSITGVALIAIFLVAFLFFPPYILSFLLFGALLAVLFFEYPKLINYKKWYFWALMPLYPVLPFLLLILLNQNQFYRVLILFLFGIVSLHDTGSYIVGKLFGQHKIAPKVSPGKTWEGFIGGYVVTSLVILIMRWYLNISTPIFIILVIILAICFISFLGDLFESLIKRKAQLKDSSSLLPGHGGFLDRLDGVLFVSYFFYLCRDVLLNVFTK